MTVGEAHRFDFGGMRRTGSVCRTSSRSGHGFDLRCRSRVAGSRPCSGWAGGRARAPPGKRCRHRCTGSGAGRIGGHSRRPASVAQIIDKDPSLCGRASTWWPRSARGCPRPLLRQGLARMSSRRPIRLSGASGTTTWSPLPPVVFTKLSRPMPRKPLAHLQAASISAVHGTSSAGSRSIVIRSGFSSAVTVRAPGMDFEHAGLHQRDQALQILDEQHLLARRLLARSPCRCRSTHASEKSIRFDSRTGSAREPAVARHVRQDPIGDIGVELGEPLFRQADVRPQHRSGCVRSKIGRSLLASSPSRPLGSLARLPSGPCRRAALE